MRQLSLKFWKKIFIYVLEYNLVFNGFGWFNYIYIQTVTNWPLFTCWTDNRPKCLEQHMTAFLSEDVVLGSTVLIVRAEDADLDPQLRFHLSGPNAAHFFLHKTTGK